METTTQLMPSAPSTQTPQPISTTHPANPMQGPQAPRPEQSEELIQQHLGLGLLPDIKVSGNTVICDGHKVPLYGKRLTTELVSMFAEIPGQLLSRDQIVSKVYRINPSRLSRSYLHSRRASVLKLIARSREVLADGLKGSPGEWIEWFAYNVDTREYQLYRIKNEYLLAKFRQLYPILPQLYK